MLRRCPGCEESCHPCAICGYCEECHGLSSYEWEGSHEDFWRRVAERAGDPTRFTAAELGIDPEEDFECRI